MKAFLIQFFRNNSQNLQARGFALLPWLLSAGLPTLADETPASALPGGVASTPPVPPAPAVPAGPPVPGDSIPAPKPHFIEQAMPFVFIFLLFYLLLIRPATKRHKKHQDFITRLKKGDQVVTASGLFGKIDSLTDTVVTLEIANNIRVKILRSQISSHAPGNEGKKPS